MTEEEMVFIPSVGRVVKRSLVPRCLESILTVSNRPFLCVFAPLREFFLASLRARLRVSLLRPRARVLFVICHALRPAAY